MKTINIYLAIAFFSIAAQATQEKKEWFECKQDADCVLVEDYCSYRAVNKNQTQDFLKTSKPSIYECQSPTPAPGEKEKFKTVCKNSMCEKQKR